MTLKIEFLKGVGTAKADLLAKELNIRSVEDLLNHFPFRYIDKTKFQKISELTGDEDYVQIKGQVVQLQTLGAGRSKRLVAQFTDSSGQIELIWFQGIKWIEDSLQLRTEYIVFGRLTEFNRKFSIAHPEMELMVGHPAVSFLAPVYPSTDKLNKKGLDTKSQRRIFRQLTEKLLPADLPEILPLYIVEKLKLLSRFQAYQFIHFPPDSAHLHAAQKRLKFEELLCMQLKILQYKNRKQSLIKGYIFEKVGDLFNGFYSKYLPFELTNAQKKVIREIRKDMGNGKQMNRLLQGDVGSGKTIVALLSMLIALDNGFQACLMAPTEILAQQHFQSIEEFIKPLNIGIGYLSGSVKGKTRNQVLTALKDGSIKIIIGTHALLEDWVEFQKIGLAIIDEQHRFGVKQRAALWSKSTVPPHILVMTATPIPRTLAMTLYGDLDVSVIDELPPGRKEIKTLHFNENKRLRLLGFIREEINKGRQIYIVYPLIEESEKLDLLDLENGYQALLREFPMPEYHISVVHGKMKPEDKEYEMSRFIKKQTQIMVATTVIEVGVNVPNASVMIIEHAERFGLSQLHQLRGRVGRGADQSYCILMTSFKLSKDSRERIKTMCETNNGFVIAEADLRLRGPGDIEGTRQSGLFGLNIADLAKDAAILTTAREIALRILDSDPEMNEPQHTAIKRHIDHRYRNLQDWSSIS